MTDVRASRVIALGPSSLFTSHRTAPTLEISCETAHLRERCPCATARGFRAGHGYLAPAERVPHAASGLLGSSCFPFSSRHLPSRRLRRAQPSGAKPVASKSPSGNRPRAPTRRADSLTGTRRVRSMGWITSNRQHSKTVSSRTRSSPGRRACKSESHARNASPPERRPGAVSEFGPSAACPAGLRGSPGSLLPGRASARRRNAAPADSP